VKYPYLKNYHPAMPALKIWLGYPTEALTIGPLVAIVDTGADSTLVPQQWLDKIEAPFSDEARLRSHWGEWREVALFTIDLGIETMRLPSVEVVGDDEGTEVILGRNVLQRLKMLLDGPSSQVEIWQK